MNSVDIAFDQISDIVGKDNFIQNEDGTDIDFRHLLGCGG